MHRLFSEELEKYEAKPDLSAIDLKISKINRKTSDLSSLKNQPMTLFQ
jgi:hypothetical protein